MTRLAALVPRLPRRVWALEAAALLTYFGSGLILPWELIYLHDVRGFPLTVAGAIAGTWPAVAIVGGFVGGAASDRFGPGRAAVAHLLLGAAGLAGLGFVAAPWQGFACSAAIGLALGGGNPSQAALLATIAGPEEGSTAFAVEFAAANAGIAAGAAVGGFVAHVGDAGTFTTLFVLDAVCTAGFAVLLGMVARGVGPPQREAGARPRGYRAALRQRAVIGFVGVTAVFAFGGVAVYERALPLFARNEDRLSEHAIGLLFLLNSLVIIIVQLPIAKLFAGRRRLRSVAGALGLWTVAWLLAAVAGAAPLLLLACVVVLFALGECVIAPIQGALIAELSADDLRGRSLALQSNAYALGMTAGPVAIGFLFERSPQALWPAAAGVVAVAALAALALEPATAARTAAAPSPA